MSFIRTSEIRIGLEFDPQRKFNKTRLNIPDKKEMESYTFFNDPTSTLLDQLKKKCTDTGVEVCHEELNELGLFHVFLESHIKPNKIRDIPCMFLWAEWVRFSIKQMNNFPTFIREKELSNLIVDMYGFDRAVDEERGVVYPGIQFIPDKTNE